MLSNKGNDWHHNTILSSGDRNVSGSVVVAVEYRRDHAEASHSFEPFADQCDKEGGRLHLELSIKLRWFGFSVARIAKYNKVFVGWLAG